VDDGPGPAPLRPLPRSLDPIAGEGLGGYLLRLSWRLRVSPLHLARLTGCVSDGPAVIRRRLLLDLDVQRFAQATRLSAGEASSLAAASWADRYPPIARSRTRPDRPIVLDGWLFSTSNRYCPDCLAGDGSPVQQQYGGPWKKTWHLPVTFACLQHQRFLREGCPQAHPGSPAPWELIAFPSASGLHPAQCRLPLKAGRTARRRPSCGIRLDQPGEDDLPRPRLHRPASDQRPPLHVLAPRPGPHGLAPGRRGQRARPPARRRLPPVPGQAARQRPCNRRAADRSRCGQGQRRPGGHLGPPRTAPPARQPQPVLGTRPRPAPVRMLRSPARGSPATGHWPEADQRPPGGSRERTTTTAAPHPTVVTDCLAR